MTTSIITLARTIATDAHHGVFRADGDPFITHPEAVAHHAATAYGADDLTIAVCWLHDVVEDTDVTLDDLALMGIPSPVLVAVDSVTIRPGEPYLVAVARARSNSIGRIVKLCDNWHNASTLDVFPEHDRRRRATKYTEARRLLTAA